MKYRFLSLFFFLSLEAYTPVEMPNGTTLEWVMEDGYKTFRLTAEPVKREFAPGLIVNCWGYNGQTPGPLIEAVEGDKVRIYVTNKLPEPTTIHWHGILLPCRMDGVGGLTQPVIQPGETFRYEFPLRQSGTYMYHPHFDEMTQIAMGMTGFFIIHPKKEEEPPIDRDFAIMLAEWAIPAGAYTPDPTVMLDFNYFTFNSRVFPGTAPLDVKQGQRVRIRFGNLSMNNHPMHLHGYHFTVTAYGAGNLPKHLRYKESTIDVPVGNSRDIQFVANVIGDWALHCHKTHHTMNGMSHELPNLLDVNAQAVQAKMKQFFPDFMTMGTTGMGEMAYHNHMPRPPNTLPYGVPSRYGIMDMGGMFTILRCTK